VAHVARHRAAVAIVAAALAVAAAAFLARPQYRSPASSKAIVFPEAKAPVHGWTWHDGTPGFRFGQDRNEWNISLLQPRELAASRRAAAQAGVAPQSLRVLQLLRSQPRVRPQVLLAGSDASGRTCIGVQMHAGPTSFVCPPQLDRAVGFVVAEAIPPRGRGRGMFLMGVSRADVTRVTVATPGATYLDARATTSVARPVGTVTVYERRQASWWGAFVHTTLQPRRWHARVTFYGSRGRLAATDLRFRHAGEQAVAAR
jgi:hypothetical protein